MHPDHKKVQDFVDWFEKTYGRKPNPDDQKPELVEKYARDMSISRQAAFFYVSMATRPERKEGESYIPSAPTNIRAGRTPLKIGDNIRLRALGAVGDPFGSHAQVALQAEIHGTVETIEDTNVTIRVEPAVVRGRVPQRGFVPAEIQRRFRQINEMSEGLVRRYNELPLERINDQRMVMLFKQAIIEGNNRAIEEMLPGYNYMTRSMLAARRNLDELPEIADGIACGLRPEGRQEKCDCQRCKILERLHQMKAEDDPFFEKLSQHSL